MDSLGTDFAFRMSFSVYSLLRFSLDIDIGKLQKHRRGDTSSHCEGVEMQLVCGNYPFSDNNLAAALQGDISFSMEDNFHQHSQLFWGQFCIDGVH